MLFRWNLLKTAMTFAALAAGLMVATATAQDAAPAKPQEAAPPANPWADTAEYELVVNGINKETNAQRKLQLLQQWKDKYPNSTFKTQRMQAFLQTYQQAGNAQKMKETAAEITAADPAGVLGLVGYQTLNLLAFSMNDKSEAALADAEKAGRGLLEIVDKVEKPAAVADDAWTKEKTNNKFLGYRTLGWVAWQRKQYDEAEKQFTEALKINPLSGEVSSWMGTVILLQRKPDKQAAGLYHFARAAALEGMGALPEASRNQAKAYVEKTYVNFHGSRDGLDEIMTRAKTEPFPLEGFKIESKLEREMKDREKLKADNPMLGRWLELRDALTAESGQTYFNDLKGTNAGGLLKGKLISATPETKPKELTLSVADGITPDVTLKLDDPLPGKADPGTELEFEGEVTAYTKEPFNLNFNVDPTKIQGWPVKAGPARKKAGARPTAKKSGAKKK